MDTFSLDLFDETQDAGQPAANAFSLDYFQAAPNAPREMPVSERPIGPNGMPVFDTQTQREEWLASQEPDTDAGRAWKSLKSFSAKEFMEENPAMNVGAWLYKKATGQNTAGTLEPVTPGVWDQVKAAGQAMAENPLTTGAEMLKGIAYAPELIPLAWSRGPQAAAAAAARAQAGRALQAAAYTGMAAAEMGGALAAESAVKQSVRKDRVDWAEAGAEAAVGAGLGVGIHAGRAAAAAGKRWANRPPKQPGEVETPVLDRADVAPDAPDMGPDAPDGGGPDLDAPLDFPGRPLDFPGRPLDYPGREPASIYDTFNSAHPVDPLTLDRKAAVVERVAAGKPANALEAVYHDTDVAYLTPPQGDLPPLNFPTTSSRTLQPLRRGWEDRARARNMRLEDAEAVEPGLDYSAFKARWDARRVSETNAARNQAGRDAVAAKKAADAAQREADIDQAWADYKAIDTKNAALLQMEDVWGEVGDALKARPVAKTGQGPKTREARSAAQRARQDGKADPKVLAAIAGGSALAIAAYTNPEEAQQLMSLGALGGVLLTTGGKAVDALPRPGATPPTTLGALIPRGRYTTTTLERLPKNQPNIKIETIRQQMKRPDVSKAEREMLEQVLRGRVGDSIPATDLVNGFRLRSGDFDLAPKKTWENADYGLARVGRKAVADNPPNMDDWEALPADDWTYLPASSEVRATTTLYQLPDYMNIPPGKHFAEPNTFGWTRSFQQGGKRHVVEVQSDVLQNQTKISYEKFEALQDEIARAEVRLQLWNNKDFPTDILADQARINQVDPTFLPDLKHQLLHQITDQEAKDLGFSGKEGLTAEALWDRIVKNGETLEEPAHSLFSQTRYNAVDALEGARREAHKTINSALTTDALAPISKNWNTRLINETLRDAAANGETSVRFADADTIAQVEHWPRNTPIEQQQEVIQWLQQDIAKLDQSLPFITSDVQRKNTQDLRDSYAKDLANLLKTLGKEFAQPGHQSLYERYQKEYAKDLQKRGAQHVVDDQGHGWWEVKTPPRGAPVNMFGHVDPKLLAAMGLTAGGAALGGYLAGDERLAGAVAGATLGLGATAGLPRVMGVLSRISSPRQAFAQAARIAGVVGAGAYLGGKSDEPVLGAVLAGGLLLGRQAMKPANKLVTDDIIRLHLGNERLSHLITKNAEKEMKALVPDDARRVAIAEALELGQPLGLTGNELRVFNYLKRYYDDIGREAVDADVLQGLRQNYVSHIIDRDPGVTAEQQASILARIFEGWDSHGTGTTSTRFAKQRKYDTFDELERALQGTGLKLKTRDAAEIFGIYARSMRSAIEKKIMLDTIKNTDIENGRKGLVPRNDKTRAPLDYVSSSAPMLRGYAVHPDLSDSLKVVFDSSDPWLITRGLYATSMAVKRSNVFGSLFHAKSLGEVYTLAMGRKVIGKHGLNKAAIDHALDQYRRVGAGGPLDLLIKEGMSFDTHPDVSKTIISDVGAAADRVFQRASGTQATPAGTVAKGIDWVNGKFDHITWDYLHTGIKAAVALKEFEALGLANAKAHAANPQKVKLKSQQELAREIATYSNDLTGGLDWFGIAADTRTQLGRAIGMGFATPAGRRIAQILLFAPDWALSTVRAGLRSFGRSDTGIIKGLLEPQNATDLYRKYAFRSTVLWLTALNGLNMMTAGQPIWDNDDPTRIQLADGTTLQAGKHTFEAVHAATDPIKFIYNKLGFVPKAGLLDPIQAYAAGAVGVGRGGLRVETVGDYLKHEGKAMLPFTVNAMTQEGLPIGSRVGRALGSAVGFPTYGFSDDQKFSMRMDQLLRNAGKPPKESKKRRY